MNTKKGCPLFPCFDTLTGAIFERNARGHVTFACRDCQMSCNTGSETSSETQVETLYFQKISLLKPEFNAFSDGVKVIDCLKNTDGICKQSVVILSQEEKKEAMEIEKQDNYENIGIYSSLTRDITIACAHDSLLRPPPMPVVLLVKDREIVGEMTCDGRKFYEGVSECACVFPPIDFPEIDRFGENIVSASPGIMLDKWLREKMKIRPTDATLLIGLNRMR